MSLNQIISQKIHSSSEPDVSDLMDYSIDLLYETLSDQLNDILKKINIDYNITYDLLTSNLLEIWTKLQIPINLNLVQKYVYVVLEKEFSYKFEYISTSLLQSLFILLEENSCSIEDWTYLYENSNKELAHIFICAIFIQSGFNYELYCDACLNCNTSYLIQSITSLGILTPDKLGLVSQKLPDYIKDKIKKDFIKQQNKIIVYN